MRKGGIFRGTRHQLRVLMVLMTAALEGGISNAERMTPGELYRAWPSSHLYFRVVDDAGNPVSGVSVRCYWERLCLPFSMKNESRVVVSDGDGMGEISVEKIRSVSVDRVAKDGYVYELTYQHFDVGGQGTRESPVVIPVRKLLPKSYLVIPDRIDTEKIIDLKSGGECVTGRVDILSTFKLGGPKTAVVDGRSKYVWPYPPPYDDFFVSARYDEASDGWRVAFWTTNANCGVIATAKRRYEAPADGYLPRAEVSQEEYLSPSFTLYLRTREPRVYAMVTPEGWTGQTPRETRGGPPGQRRFRFQLREARVNPYGTREMELDGRGQHFFLRGAVKKCVFDNLLKAKRYPPRLDFAALHELACEEDRLFGVIAAQESAANRAEQSARTKALEELPQGPVGAEAMEGVRRAGREARRKAFPKLCEAEDERARVRQRIDDIIRKANEELDRQK